MAALLIFTLVYKYTLRAWFQSDDFAWLGLQQQVHNWPQFWRAMFTPMAQGTVRPFSERAFFMGFYSLFGLHALPYRIAVYVTQLANIAVLGMIARRLTNWYWASLVVPALWTVNSVLAWPLTWTSAYNEILCSLIFLVSFYALLRYVETDDWRYNALQWAAFLIGFGVLEINVVYPLIAILYTAWFAPKFVRRTLPLVIPSILFSIIHFAAIAIPQNNIYALHVDLDIFQTLARYWSMALGFSMAGEYFAWIRLAALPLTVAVSIAIFAFAAWRAWRGDRIPIFCLFWFLIAIGPFLPISAHTSDYYAAVPSIGLALVGGCAVAASLRSAWVYRLIGLGLAALYLAAAIPLSRLASNYIQTRSASVRKLVLGVRGLHEKNPGKIIFLEDVSDELFWDSVYHRPFRLFGAEVYLTPANAGRIHPHPEFNDVAEYMLPENEMLSALAQKRALVYGLEGGELRDIAGLFDVTRRRAGIPGRIELGRPPLESMLGASWYGSEGDYRWMPKDASVHLGIPESGQGEVRVVAFCAPVQIEKQPLAVWVTIDGKAAPRSTIRSCNLPVILLTPFHAAPGATEIEVGLHVDRTLRIAGDQRDLGLGVRTIEVLP